MSAVEGQMSLKRELFLWKTFAGYSIGRLAPVDWLKLDWLKLGWR